MSYGIKDPVQHWIKHQTIYWTKEFLSIGALWKNLEWIMTEEEFSINKKPLKMSSAKWFIPPFCFYLIVLTHWGRVTHICVSKLTIIASDLNQRWNIVNWTLRNKLQWNFNRNSNIFIHENAFENVVWEMTAILFLAHCVKPICYYQWLSSGQICQRVDLPSITLIRKGHICIISN